MDDRQRELDQRIRKARRQELLRMLWESKLLVILGVVMLGAVIASASFATAPTKLEATVMGRTLNEATARSNKQGQAVRLEVVQLDNGAVVDINMTADAPVPAGTAVKIEVYQKDWGPLHQMSYRFAGYVDAASTS